MESFDFVSDEIFRELLERDFKELQTCMKSSAYKSVLVLSGSIIEAILIEYFLHNLPNGKTKSQLFNLKLVDLIEEAHNTKLISTKSKDLSSVVRNYRNLIHPGKEYRTQESLDEETANVSVSLVKLILKEIKENYIKKYGYKAEDIFNKILSDDSALPIFEKLLDKINQTEKNRLLEILTEYKLKNGRVKESKSLNDFFEITLKCATEGKIIEQLKKLVKLVEQGTEETTVQYFLFYGDYIDLLPTEDKELTISYIYGIVETYLYRGGNYSYIWWGRIYSIFTNNINTELLKTKYFDLLKSIVSQYIFNKSQKKETWRLHSAFSDLLYNLTEDQKHKVEKYLKSKFPDSTVTEFYKYIEEDLPF